MNPSEDRRPILLDTPRRRRVHDRIKLAGEGPQAHYRDAVRILTGQLAIDSASNVLGHLMREIEGAVGGVIVPLVKSVDVSEAIPGVEEGKDHERRVRGAIVALGLPGDHPAAVNWIQISRSGGFASLAHRRALERPRAVDDDLRDRWDQLEEILDVVLERVEARFIDFHAEIDRLVQKDVPTKHDVSSVLNNLPNHVTIRAYLFGNLQKRGWLGPLREAGFFSAPPPVSRDDATGNVVMAPWPQSQFLRKMASDPESAPDVAAILAALPNTENVLVQENVVEIALLLPASLVSSLVDRVCAWLPPSGANLMLEKAAQLALRLLTAGQQALALRLLRAALYPVRSDDAAWQSGHEGYEIREVVTNVVPEFVNAIPLETLNVLCDLLDESVRANNGENEAHGGSRAWRRAIGSGESFQQYDVSHILVDAVRDTAKQITGARPEALKDVVDALRNKKGSVFRRVALYLMTAEPLPWPEGAEAMLLAREDFELAHELPEYLQLLKSAFAVVQPEARERILGWILAGPLQPPEYPVDESFVRAWRRVRLRTIWDQLPDDWADKFADLKPAVIPQEDAGPRVRSVGLSTPRGKDEIAALGVDGLVEFLRSWQPPSGLFEPTREGLGVTLSHVVAAAPEEYATASRKFVGLRPTYVRSLLQGFREAVTASRPFAWSAVLELCDWVVSLGHAEGVGLDEDSEETGWSWTRLTIASLLVAGLDSKTGGLPVDLREQVWRVLDALSWDRDPSAERDAAIEPEDALDLAINCVRGEALIGVVRYAVWVCRHEGAANEGGITMAVMPEVRRNLEQHLNVEAEKESSPAIWAVIGESFPVLHWIDPAWASSQVERIFPDAAERERLSRASRTTYLKFAGPFNPVFDALQPVYGRAVEELAAGMDQSRVKPHSSAAGLAQHLMSFYWSGLSGAAELAQRFFETAPPPLQAWAIEFVGRSLVGGKGPLPQEVENRLRELWIQRFDVARPDELEKFGWWFASSALDLDWSFEQALRVLDRGVSLEPDHLVVQSLLRCASTRPVDVARVFDGVAKCLKDNWTFYGWRREGRKVLSAVLATGDVEAAAIVRQAISRLAAKGHGDYRDLA